MGGLRTSEDHPAVIQARPAGSVDDRGWRPERVDNACTGMDNAQRFVVIGGCELFALPMPRTPVTNTSPTERGDALVGGSVSFQVRWMVRSKSVSGHAVLEP